MPALMTIGEVAHQAHIATSTIRYYERRGLGKPLTPYFVEVIFRGGHPSFWPAGSVGAALALRWERRIRRRLSATIPIVNHQL